MYVFAIDPYESVICPHVVCIYMYIIDFTDQKVNLTLL